LIQNRIWGFDDKKFWGKKFAAKIFFKKHFLSSKIEIYLSLGIHKGGPSYRRGLLKREHPLQNMTFLKFLLP
jgi:hypothetical protein